MWNYRCSVTSFYAYLLVVNVNLCVFAKIQQNEKVTNLIIIIIHMKNYFFQLRKVDIIWKHSI